MPVTSITEIRGRQVLDSRGNPTVEAEVLLGGFFFSSRRRHTRGNCDWSSDVCSSDLAAQLFLPRGIDPQFLGTPPLAPAHVFGELGLLLALVGLLFAVGGAAIETCFSGAYNLAQFFGWPWGKRERPARASRFTLSWLVIFALALLVVMTGYDPVKLTEYAVVFSVVALPLTYLPILLVANDRRYMGSHANGRLANVLGVVYFAIILVV